MYIFLGFLIIACMRVVQKICGKKESYLIEPGISFFRYTAIAKFFAAVFALFAFINYGCHGFNLPTIICSILMAIMFALDGFTGVEAIKGASLVVCNMYANGGLIISCVLSWVFFGEAMTIPQIIGLVLFFVSVYLLTPDKKSDNKKISKRTFIMLIGSTLVNGAVMLIQKFFSLKVEGGNSAMFSFLTFAFSSIMTGICWGYYVVKNKKNGIKEVIPTVTVTNKDGSQSKKERKLFLGMPYILYLYACLLALALFLINLLVTEMGKTVSAIVLFPISSCISVLITVLVGWILFKEKLSLKNIIGLILGVVCIIVISTFTPETMTKIFG